LLTNQEIVRFFFGKEIRWRPDFSLRVGTALAKAGLKYAREQRLQVIPKCEFVASYIERHPEFAHLLGSGS
jgi:GCN5-related N-acetyl-transferase